MLVGQYAIRRNGHRLSLSGFLADVPESPQRALFPADLYKTPALLPSRGPNLRKSLRDLRQNMCKTCHKIAAPHFSVGTPEGTWLLEQTRQLDIEANAPRPLMLGRHLLELGIKPGPDFGTLLDHAYEAQLDGAFEDIESGYKYLQKLIKGSLK